MIHRTRWTAFTICLVTLSTSVPSFSLAAEDATPPPAQNQKKSAKDNKENKSPPHLAFSLQHQVGNAAPTAATQAPFDPLGLLENFKSSFTERMAKANKPVDITTLISIVLPEEAQKTLGNWQIPAVQVKTRVDSDGRGISALSMPAFEHQIDAQADGKWNIVWQGLTGKSDFSAQFATLNIGLDAPKLQVTGDKKNFSLSSDKYHLVSELNGENGYLVPAKINFSLSQFLAHSEENQFDVRNVTYNLSAPKPTPQGLELPQGSFTVQQLAFTDKVDKGTLNNLQGQFGIELQGDTVTPQVKTHIDKVMLPLQINNTPFQMNNLQLDLALQRIDAAVVADLQKNHRQLQGQTLDSQMSGMMWLGKLMQVLPQLWSKSPEIRLNTFQLESNQGNLQAMFNLGVDGKKPFSMKETRAILLALRGQAKISVDKSLLENLIAYNMVTHDKVEQAKAKTEVQKRINKWIADKWIVVSGNTYQLAAQLQEGKLLVNDVEKPLPGMDK